MLMTLEDFSKIYIEPAISAMLEEDMRPFVVPNNVLEDLCLDKTTCLKVS
jgi:hypothetical protein